VDNTSLMTRLREETRSEHTRLEQVDFSRRLMSDSLSLPEYLHYLQAFKVIHAGLEGLWTTFDPRVRATWERSRHKSASIAADLAHFEADLLPEWPCQRGAADGLVVRVCERARERPVAMLGALYVLEGSTLGGQILGPKVVRMFGLGTGPGADYLKGYGKSTGIRWREFKEAMNALRLSQSEEDAIVSTAAETFNGIREILTSLSSGQPPGATGPAAPFAGSPRERTESALASHSDTEVDVFRSAEEGSRCPLTAKSTHAHVGTRLSRRPAPSPLSPAHG
jgi:heme oxygenase